MQYFTDLPNQPPITTSFVQTRGSIPLYWKQDINLAYEPPIEIGIFYILLFYSSLTIAYVTDDTPLRLHLSEQINFYNKQVILNLVKKKGAEMSLGKVW